MVFVLSLAFWSRQPTPWRYRTLVRVAAGTILAQRCHSPELWHGWHRKSYGANLAPRRLTSGNQAFAMIIVCTVIIIVIICLRLCSGDRRRWRRSFTHSSWGLSRRCSSPVSRQGIETWLRLAYFGQYAHRPGNRSHFHAGLAIPVPAVAYTVASTHCTYPRRDGQAEWAWMVYLQVLTGLDVAWLVDVAIAVTTTQNQHQQW